MAFTLVIAYMAIAGLIKIGYHDYSVDYSETDKTTTR